MRANSSLPSGLVAFWAMLGVACAGGGVWAAPDPAEDEAAARAAVEKRFTWHDGPGTMDLGDQAQIDLAADHTFLDRAGCQQMMELTGNLLTQREVGLVVPKAQRIGSWTLVFEFNDMGYVKDDEKDSLDADAMLKAFKENDVPANKERLARGYPALHTIGWRTPPRYNEQTNNLEWCLELESQGQRVLNHQFKVLGRHGVMEVVLICSPETLDSSLAEARRVLAAMTYKPGRKYSEFRSGDKIATIGLTALVTGGALAVAAKTGLLGKLIKPILIGLLAVGAAVGTFFKKIVNALFGRHSADAT